MCHIKIIDIFPGKVAVLLLDSKIYTLQDLLQKTEKDLLAIQGFGKKRLQIVREVLAEVKIDWELKR
jgi:DNA-directed RNA polymerase alpha subunit